MGFLEDHILILVFSFGIRICCKSDSLNRGNIHLVKAESEMSANVGEKDEDWTELFSKTHSRPYWFNSKTQKSVWENPISAHSNLSGKIVAQEKVDTSGSKKSIWQQMFSTKFQCPYWFNPVTNESVWQDPMADTKNSVSEEHLLENDHPHKKQKTDSTSAHSTSSPVVTKVIPTSVTEDFPSLAIERERLREECHAVLVRENAKYGIMQGKSKTAIACRSEGDAAGLQGLFARIMWHQLLCEIERSGDVGCSMQRDGIFPTTTVPDEAVTKELVDAGRSPTEAAQVLTTVLISMQRACSRLAEMRKTAHAIDQDVILSSGSMGDSNVHEASTDGKVSRAHQNRQTRSRPQLYSLQYGSKAFSISHVHLQKLLHLYQIHTDPTASLETASFLRRTFCVLARYESLSGASDGYQMAFPHTGFQWLRDNVGVHIECFASPLNCWNQRICSVARDTDQFFGSMGNFFLFDGRSPTGIVGSGLPGLPLGGSFEANPPFVESVMNQMAHHIEKILTRFEHNEDVPFSFSVIVPAWTDCEGIDVMTNSRFLRPKSKYVLRLEKRKHNYRPGMQHRTTHEEQPSNVDTFVFFLQNNAGSRRWPLTVEKIESLKTRLLEDTVSGR